MLPGDVNLKIQVIDILFQYFVCFYVRQDVILYSRILYMKTNKQIKQKQFENFSMKDPIPFGKIAWNSKIMVLTEGEKSIVEILWLVAWYTYDSSRHVYILFNSEFLWTLAVKAMGLVSTYKVTEI